MDYASEFAAVMEDAGMIVVGGHRESGRSSALFLSADLKNLYGDVQDASLLRDHSLYGMVTSLL